eukprot:CAMPEP_0172374740 /NCGR_PEP_ID=MMETSP1060-20121228/57311_1 /TAXON_ID=37318 /ORGANISM="Pseudo-nitzschia pungens, Strain cf. cingulata" /LENGTH=116 /DNA_ID=CAMNT_0013101537 /DNA_START=23 /DNA_END=369 /DNA_ORIENTATION=-
MTGRATLSAEWERLIALIIAYGAKEKALPRPSLARALDGSSSTLWECVRRMVPKALFSEVVSGVDLDRAESKMSSPAGGGSSSSLPPSPSLSLSVLYPFSWWIADNSEIGVRLICG